mmetsp:Transcript_22385/g.66360  ORF Transcript_22385/g.66360 Transcript_22385/m.66360 type:complete len:340 (+) Transcript_22385:519-1538(+)
MMLLLLLYASAVVRVRRNHLSAGAAVGDSGVRHDLVVIICLSLGASPHPQRGGEGRRGGGGFSVGEGGAGRRSAVEVHLERALQPRGRGTCLHSSRPVAAEALEGIVEIAGSDVVSSQALGAVLVGAGGGRRRLVRRMLMIPILALMLMLLLLVAALMILVLMVMDLHRRYLRLRLRLSLHMHLGLLDSRRGRHRRHNLRGTPRLHLLCLGQYGMLPLLPLAHRRLRGHGERPCLLLKPLELGLDRWGVVRSAPIVLLPTIDANNRRRLLLFLIALRGVDTNDPSPRPDRTQARAGAGGRGRLLRLVLARRGVRATGARGGSVDHKRRRGSSPRPSLLL